MQRGFKIIAVVIVVTLLVLTSLYILMWDMKRRSYTSQYEYHLEIHPDSDISDVRVIAPLPGELSEEEMSVPEGWDIEFHDEITVEGVNYENMLAIEADEISGGSYPTLFVTMDSDEEIDTMDPWDDEPMIEPKNDVEETNCDYPGASDEVECYRYSGVIIAQFQAEEDTRTDISVEIYGSNTWWVGGWSGNEYNDRLWVQVADNGKGTYEGSGKLRTGVGNY